MCPFDATHAAVQRPTFFLHSISSPNPLTLDSLKAIIEVYIDRDLPRLEELVAERRPGRPKTKEQLDLEERRRIETKEYEDGIGECDCEAMERETSLVCLAGDYQGPRDGVSGEGINGMIWENTLEMRESVLW